ncbi:unnamed protein product [Orchesella dallaii]|uniref:C2H2-type domain-containing protein n=1 Tax=Orchesella dallaii TaxID=48710 RepID=A0ABP1RVW0_9HEXA
MSSIHNQATIPGRLANLTEGDNLDDLPSRCFICYCWRDNETLTATLKSRSALSKNLLVVFVLQKLYALPSENVCHYLKKFGEPAEWIWFCKSCTSKIEDAKGIHKQLLWLEGWFRKVKDKLKDDIKDSVIHRPVDRKRKSMQTNLKITDELREAVLNQREVDGSGYDELDQPNVSIADRRGFSNISTSTHPLERSSQRVKTDAVRSYADPVEQKRSNQLIENLSYSEEDREIKCEQLSPPTSPACVSDDDDEDMDYYPSPLGPDKPDYCHSDTNHTTGVGPYRCEVKDCNFEFQATNDLRIHLFEKHGRFINKGRTRPLEVYEIEKCTVCDLSFPAYSFEMHMKIHHSNQLNSGNETENGASTMDSTLSSNEISTHWLNLNLKKNNLAKFECSICLRNQSNQELLDQHLKLHKSSPYNCFVCLSVVKDGNILYNHMYRCHPEYKTSFSSIKKATKLNELEGVNEVVKIVKCSKCTRFLPLAQMPEHMELHEKSPYRCNICRTVYEDKIKLYSHYCKYHKEKEVEMDKLRIEFGIRKNNKRISIRKERKSTPKTERRKKNEKCSKCTRYIPLSEMPEHMELHEKSPYSCHFCGNVFNDKHNLFKHYLKYHNEDKMTLDKIRADLGIQKSMKGRKNSQTKRALENKATIKYESDSDSNENERDTEPMDDNDDEWKPPQSRQHVTPRVNQKYTERRQYSTEHGEDNPNTGLRNLTDQSRKKIRCPLCVQFECYIDKREKLCEHLESCKGFDENTNEEFIELEQFCPVCSNFKCSNAEKSDFIKHLMACRGAINASSEADIPLYERLYQSNLCPTTKYFNLDTFLAHFVFHKKNIYKCSKCPRRFSLTCSVHTHWKSHHQESMKVQYSRRFFADFAVPEVPWWCSVCNERFDNEERRDLHLQTMHQKEVSKTHICQHCSKGLSCPEELKLHQGISHVSANRTYNCFVCQERFLTATLRRLHMKGSHDVSNRSGPERLVCDVCGIECRTKGNLKMHLQIHQEVRDFVCAECGKSFTTRQFLRNHKFRDHVPADDKINPLTCRICKKTFHNKSYLNKHNMTVHEKKYSFFCDKCGNGFLYMCRLKRHLMIQHGVGEPLMHICPIESCKKTFWSITHFKNHMARHRNEPKYKCRFCGKDFFCNSRRHRHEQIHTNAKTKPYQCEICNKRFPVRNYLYIHMKSHRKKQEEQQTI